MFIGLPEFSSWDEWSSCSRTCGNGDRTRNRKCDNNCEAVTSEDKLVTETCNESDCKLF